MREGRKEERKKGREEGRFGGEEMDFEKGSFNRGKYFL